MKWDEERFGLELDLDQYKIVAVGDFNSGAMENKGLNIFNTKYVLARADTATDVDYLNIDRVVAHEYFHNWTGNRVTCRDWFQLSLKEGLTVFRDQEYGADTYSRAVTRIQEVRGLRAGQFPEDAGPMEHPVRPQSYMEIRNFYTMTVYEKGAEVVRMQHTLLGEEKFQAGMRLYFQRHDGQAVTCDDFVQAMEDASGTDASSRIDLSQFRRWYDVAGTPVLDCKGEYSARHLHADREAVDESAVPHPVRREDRRPREGPLAQAGRGEVHLRREGKAGPFPAARLLGAGDPRLPVHRGRAAAPDGARRRRLQPLGGGAAACQRHHPGEQRRPLARVPRRRRKNVLAGPDPAFAAEALALPSETFLAEQMKVVDPDALHAGAQRACARRWQRRWPANSPRSTRGCIAAARIPRTPHPPAGARCATCASAISPRSACGRSAYEQFRHADNMTDAMAALTALANLDCPERLPALEDFYARWKDEPLVVDKWLAVQAGSRLPGTLARVRELLAHPAFDIKVPNKVYALIRTFAANHVRFHAADGCRLRVPRRPGAGARPRSTRRSRRAWRAASTAGSASTRRGRQKAKAALERIRDADGPLEGRRGDRDKSIDPLTTRIAM